MSHKPSTLLIPGLNVTSLHLYVKSIHIKLSCAGSCIHHLTLLLKSKVQLFWATEGKKNVLCCPVSQAGWVLLPWTKPYRWQTGAEGSTGFSKALVKHHPLDPCDGGPQWGHISNPCHAEALLLGRWESCRTTGILTVKQEREKDMRELTRKKILFLQRKNICSKTKNWLSIWFIFYFTWALPATANRYYHPNHELIY